MAASRFPRGFRRRQPAQSARSTSPAGIPNRLQCCFLIFRVVGIPPAARMLSRILRGFLEREANVKQTHWFR